MKTGRLLKFQRPQGEIHAYLFQEGGRYHAQVYSLAGGRGDGKPIHSVEGATESAVEAEVRRFVDQHFPKTR